MFLMSICCDVFGVVLHERCHSNKVYHWGEISISATSIVTLSGSRDRDSYYSFNLLNE